MVYGLLRSLPFACCFLLVIWLGNVEAQLSSDYYGNSCPNLESIVRTTLGANLFTDPTAPAALVRLVFHDCQVGGCDASILLDSGPNVQSELQSQANLGIRRLDFIDRIKRAVEAACPNTVSCADIIALAGRDAISMTGGPRIDIPLGREDGFSASPSLADSALPPATISIDNFLNLFGAMGMSMEESVAIIGAHTLGIAHCPNIVNRLYPTKDPNLGFFFANSLRARCPPAFNNAAFVNLDSTNVVFDAQYFRDVIAGRGVLTIDSELGLDSRTVPLITQFANNRNDFFQTFSSAFVKLSSYQVLTGGQGEIRQNCHSVN